MGVLCDLPFDLAPPHTQRHDQDDHIVFLWSRLLNPDHPDNVKENKQLSDEERARIVSRVLSQCPRALQLRLKHALDEKDREVFALTDKKTKEAINSVIFFTSRYDIDWNDAPVHVSDTCILVKAVDHKAVLNYEAVFANAAGKGR